MSTFEALAFNDSVADGVRFRDVHESTVVFEAVPQESGNIELAIETLGEQEEVLDGNFSTLSPQQRRVLAAVLLGMDEQPHGYGQPVQDPGKMRVVMETGGKDWSMTPEDFDYMWARAGWHVRNGIPGFIQHSSGSKLSIHEVAETDQPPAGMFPVRRHYRYLLKGDGPTDWKFHNSYAYIRKLNPVKVEMQRSFKSDWKKA